MAIIPSLQNMNSMSQIMAKTLQSLHEFIEKECNHDKPEEIMVLMMSFCTGTILQLRDKIETMEEDLGNRFLDIINEVTNKNSKSLETVDKLNKNDPSLDKSPSGIDPNDLPAAIEFLEAKFRKEILTHFDELPFKLRNETTLFNALAMLLVKLFYRIDNKNTNSLIDHFIVNMRSFNKEMDTTSRNDRQSFH